ncbi:hypothetical protein JJD41_17230 [Oxynema sp. CENA135]|uniref:hypothetical protein n=1 Tax=Oxynema sp. CENA135 TaxID=984206 RepID=UPI00190D3AF6|nr:hypothetical protein [Oxynema sp. CENA135]MBK4731594.1 hypothetical protein [Oxynema sp. CENA135]
MNSSSNQLSNSPQPPESDQSQPPIPPAKPPTPPAKPPEAEATPSEPTVEAPETEAQAPETAVEPSPAEAEAPETEAQAPETAVEPSPAEAEAPETEAEGQSDDSSDRSSEQSASEVSSHNDLTDFHKQPIPPPSEPKQYRAVGLIRGRYQPSEEQFTRGILLTSDGTEIDAVLLGRVMSLVKNHLDLEQEHLWVVYPRTRQNTDNLHAQIMGVWEPEKLATETPDERGEGTATEGAESSEESQEAIAPAPTLQSHLEDGYFSIRGEVIFQSQPHQYIIIKIRQTARKDSEKPKFFKLKLKGLLSNPKAVGHFWDLHVHRVGEQLEIDGGNHMGFVGAKRKKPFSGRPRGKGPGRHRGNARPVTKGGKRAGSAPSSSKPSKKNPPSKSE